MKALPALNAYLQSHPEKTEASMGLRFTFWKYSLKLIAEKPLLGHGTGSFAKEYQRIAGNELSIIKNPQVPSNELFITKNPHNEFLMISTQLGLLGLLIYLGLSYESVCLREKIAQ